MQCRCNADGHHLFSDGAHLGYKSLQRFVRGLLRRNVGIKKRTSRWRSYERTENIGQGGAARPRQAPPLGRAQFSCCRSEQARSAPSTAAALQGPLLWPLKEPERPAVLHRLLHLYCPRVLLSERASPANKLAWVVLKAWSSRKHHPLAIYHWN